MTKAYIDSASIHSALGALLIGKERLAASRWEQQSLVEVTYLLMQSNVYVVPGLGDYLGPSGPYQYVLHEFPRLEEPLPPNHRRAVRLTKSWAARNPDLLRTALDGLRRDPAWQTFSNNGVECFWLHHVQMFGGLFNRDFIPESAKILGCTPGELLAIRDRSADVERVRQWILDGRQSDEAALAERGYWLGALLRGRLHEHLAKASSLQLIAHPFRRAVQLNLAEGAEKPVLRSEELFTRMLIGAALLQRRPEQRVLTWIEGVRKARDAVLTGAVALPETILEARAEAYAITAAKTLGVGGHSKVLARTIDVTVSVGLPVLFGLTVSPWGFLSPVAPPIYRYLRGASVGDDLARVARSTRSHFRALAKLVPGRVERHLRSG